MKTTVIYKGKVEVLESQYFLIAQDVFSVCEECGCRLADVRKARIRKILEKYADVTPETATLMLAELAQEIWQDEPRLNRDQRERIVRSLDKAAFRNYTLKQAGDCTGDSCPIG